MKYLAAYALLVLGGKASPSNFFSYILFYYKAADDLKALLKEVGVDA